MTVRSCPRKPHRRVRTKCAGENAGEGASDGDEHIPGEEDASEKAQLPISVATPKGKQPPIVPWVLEVADRRQPYRAPQLQARSVLYETPATVRLKGDSGDFTTHHHLIYCLPDAACWIEALRLRDDFDRTLRAYGEALLQLGNYSRKLEEAGGSSRVATPLSSTVVENFCAPEEDFLQRGLLFSPWFVERITRFAVIRHTPKMIKVAKLAEAPGTTGQISYQHNFWLCPSDEAWDNLQAVRAKALQAAQKIEQFRRSARHL